MKYPPIKAVAQEIVDAIKPLVGHRTINIMNPAGIIVASSDPLRVGTFHQGAAEAAATLKPVRINPDEVSSYRGAKEGINLPVIKSGELLGVVGIYGVPEEVEQSANLLGACVNLYLDQAQAIRKTQLRRDLQLTLLRRMLAGDMVDRDELMAGGRELSVDLRLPMRAVVVTPAGREAKRRHGIELLDRAHSIAAREGWVDVSRDVFAVMDAALVVMKHLGDRFDVDAFAAAVRSGLVAELGIPVGVAVGGRADDWRELALSHREARALAELSDGIGYANIDALPNKVGYMLDGCLRSSVAERHLAMMRQALVNGFGRDGLDEVMDTIRAYCDAGCRCGAAAAALGIHKNSMNYRVNKVLALVGMEGSGLFDREFFLRLLVLRHRRGGG